MKHLWLLGAAALVLAGCGGSVAPAASSPAGNAPPSTASSAAASSAVSTAPVTSAASVAASGSTSVGGSPAGSAGAVAPLNPAIHVRIGYLGLGAEAAIFIAQERGYFKDEGLDTELLPFSAGLTDQLPAMLKGDLDFDDGTLDPGAINAATRNTGLRLVLPLATVPATDKSAAIIVRQDLVDGGQYKSPADLKGLHVALFPAAGTTVQYEWELALAKGGLKLTDVSFQTVNFPTSITALANKSLDAALLPEPFVSVAEAQHLATPEIWGPDFLPPNFDPVGYFISPAFASAHADA
ncbi:MAG: ABC transporter substrate-binding protein, partial [Chloroflexi bacterium]|nr:ABC transporter substrate-binding protein [Chloroflexota bacterium]